MTDDNYTEVHSSSPIMMQQTACTQLHMPAL